MLQCAAAFPMSDRSLPAVGGLPPAASVRDRGDCRVTPAVACLIYGPAASSGNPTWDPSPGVDGNRIARGCDHIRHDAHNAPGPSRHDDGYSALEPIPSNTPGANNPRRGNMAGLRR